MISILNTIIAYVCDIHNSRQEKSIGRHFSAANHQGDDDMTVTVLEFIKNQPCGEQAVTIRN